MNTQIRPARSSLNIRQFTPSTLISIIRKHDGQISNGDQDINKELKVFYSSLYTSGVIHNPSSVESFFQSIDLPKISEAFMEPLEEPLSLEETKLALCSMQHAKAPGPDGFTVEFFKKSGDKLLPVLLTVFEESFVKGHFHPRSLRPLSHYIEKGSGSSQLWILPSDTIPKCGL